MQDPSEYYELAVSRNPNSVEDMRNSVWASFYHKISSDDRPQYTSCPAGSESWWKYPVAEEGGK